MAWLQDSIANAQRAIRDSRVIQLLLIVLIGCVALRFYGLHNAENTDEYNEVFEALRVASGQFNLNRWHKKGFQNILAIEFGFYFVIGYLFQIFKNPMDFAAQIVHNMEPLFLIGRYTNAVLGSASVLLLFLAGRRIFNDRVGLIAALLLSVTTMHVWTSHLATTDVPLTFFFLLSFFFVATFFESGRVRDYVLAAFFGAVAINVKIIGVGIGVIFLGAHLGRLSRLEQPWFKGLLSREIGYSCLAFVAGFLISNPAVVLGLKQWAMSFVWQYGIYTNVYDEATYIVGNAYYTYLIAAYDEFGVLVSAAIGVGILFALIKRSAWDYTLLAFCLVMFLILANSSYLVDKRYMMTMVPVLYLFAARWVDAGCAAALGSPRMRNGVMSVVAVALIAHPLTRSLEAVTSLTEENTSKVSKRWIEENVPAGSKLLVDAGHTIITSGPRLNQSRRKLEEQLATIRNLKEGQTYDSPQVKIVDSYSSIYFELLLRRTPAITYDITTTELGRKIESIEYYREQGFDYVVHIRDLRHWLDDPAWRKKHPKSAAFYESMDKELTLLQTFAPSRWRSGETVQVFRISR